MNTILITEIENLTAYDLINRATEIFDDDSEIEREILKAAFLTRAAELGNESAVKKLIDKLSAEDRKLAKQADDEQKALMAYKQEISLATDRRGILPTIDNFKTIFLEDNHYSGIRFNLLRNCAEIHEFDSSGDLKSIRRMEDADYYESMRYIEKKYGIYSTEKHNGALKTMLREREYHPIIELLNTIKWDGVERCEEFLTKYLKCDDTPYTREVSRLIFSGGIWRLFVPGCKFDDVPILIGEQGTGKSSICRFLAMNDDFFGEVKSMSGNQAIEQLQGKWICEIQELSAMTKAKEIEEVKAYITRQRDQYRKAYDRETSELPRRVIFIGTSNTRSPLIDKTGNRRFYPVICKIKDRYEISDKEEEIREYVRQCWAEAREKFEQGKMPNYAKKELAEEYKKAQDDAMQDDWRVGAIDKYLRTLPIGYLVCARELAHRALSPSSDRPCDPSLKDSKEIGEMMSFFDNWEREQKTRWTKDYGSQRCWKKVREKEIADEFETPDANALPF